MRRLVSRAFTKVQRFAADWHANSFSGATVRKISRGMWAYDDFADVVFFGFLPAAVVLVGVTAILFLRWPLMGGFVVAAVLLYCALSIVLTLGYVAPGNRRMNAADSELGAAMADAITCNIVVKGYGAERREERRFGEVSRAWADMARGAWTRELNVSVLQSLLTLALQGGLLGLALWFWSRGQASAGDVVFVVTSYFLINGYLREIGTHVRTIQQAVNELDDLVRFDRQAPGVVDRADARTLSPERGEIRFEEVTFGYGGQSAPLYEDFTLTISAGERVALVGPSGSGKSTFVKLVQRLYDIQAGRILIDGQDIAAATQESVRRAIALVPQDPALFHRTLAENIAYARPEAAREDIRAAAHKAHADAFVSRLPQGYDTLVGERGVKLSGGERQRIAIARAFLADAPILVLDEATSSLDSVTEAEIQASVESLMEGRTTIVIAHRLSTLRAVDRILVFRDGAIVEEGSRAALLADRDGHFRRLHAMQLAGLTTGED